MAQLNLLAIKKELQKLTDVAYLRAELHRIADEIKNFDMNFTLTPQAKVRLKNLEKKFKVLKTRLNLAQKQVDLEIKKFVQVLRKNHLSPFVKAKKKTRKVNKTARTSESGTKTKARTTRRKSSMS